MGNTKQYLALDGIGGYVFDIILNDLKKELQEEFGDEGLDLIKDGNWGHYVENPSPDLLALLKKYGFTLEVLQHAND